MLTKPFNALWWNRNAKAKNAHPVHCTVTIGYFQPMENLVFILEALWRIRIPKAAEFLSKSFPFFASRANFKQ